MSDLELLVINDMYDKGFNPNSEKDIKLYWELMLS